MKALLSTVVMFLSMWTLCAQDISISTDRLFNAYAPGETATFIVESDRQGELAWEIRHNLRTEIIDSGVLNHDGGTSTISYPFASPAFITFEASIDGESAAIAATFGKDDIYALAEEPADFDAFWDQQKNDLAQIPLDVVEWEFEENRYSKTYRFSLEQVDGRRVYGYMVIPDGEGLLPATLRLPPYGSGRNIITPDVQTAERGNCIALSVNIHNVPPDEEDPNAYEPNEINDRNNIYYRYAILSAIRAIDYLETQDRWNKEDLLIYGDSQGGGLSMLVAGIDQRPTHLIQSVAALSQHGGKSFGRPSGFPFYLESAEARFDSQDDILDVFNATKYYDAVFAARRFTGPSMHFISFLDDVCPPATAYAAHNEMKGPRIMLNHLDAGHSSPNEYINDRRQFFREYFDASRTPNFIWEDDTRSHFIDAGEALSISKDTTIMLSPSFGFNQVDQRGQWPMEWDVVEGPGTVEFDDEFLPNTAVTFSDSGEYRLRLRVTDPYPEEEQKYWTLTDELLVSVGGGTMIVDTMQVDTTVSGVGDITLFGELTLSPNPTVDRINLSMEVHESVLYHARLRDLSGRTVQVFQPAFAKTGIHRRELRLLNVLKAGTYLLSLEIGNSLVTKRVVVEP